jgi:hypothetical protein
VLCAQLLKAIEGGDLTRQLEALEQELARLQQHGGDPDAPADPLAAATQSLPRSLSADPLGDALAVALSDDLDS